MTYDNKESSCNAIVSLNLGLVVICRWAGEGKTRGKGQGYRHQEETGDDQADEQHFGSDRPKIDLSKHHRIYVGGLSPEIDMNQLRNAFSAFGEISNCFVKSFKSCGFCTFMRKEDAAEALKQMDGQELGGQKIWTRWADNKPLSGMFNLDFEQVFNSTSPNNCNVHVMGVSGVALRQAFNQFGRVLKLSHFKEKGYAFVNYDNKESACKAIVSLNFTEIGGQVVMCSWGKEDRIISKGHQHKEDFAGHQVEPGVHTDEPGDLKSQDNFLGCSCCHHNQNSAGHKEEAGDHMAEPQARVQFQPLKGLRPFHAPRPQQYAFWM